MESVALLLVLKHTAVSSTELSLIKRFAEALACLGNLLLDLLVVLGYLIFDKYIGTIAFLRVAVVDKGVVKGVHVSARLPYCWVHKDSRVDAHDILVKKHHALPPVFLDVVLKFNAVLSIIIDSGKTVINLAAWEHETILLAVTHDFLENVCIKLLIGCKDTLF